MPQTPPDDWAEELDEFILSNSSLLPDDYESPDLPEENNEAELPEAPLQEMIPAPLPDVFTVQTAPVPADPPQPLQARRPDFGSTEKVLDFNKLFQSLAVRWDSKTPYRVLASIRKRAALIGWTQDDLLSVEKSLGIYTSVPRTCPGDDTIDPQSGMTVPGCPCKERYGADPKVWAGLPCPGETMRIYQLLVQYVRGLSIDPTEHIDLQQVGDIIRLQIQMERCDLSLKKANEALFAQQVNFLDQKTGTAYWTRIISASAAFQKSLRTDRDKIYKDLLGTRLQRSKAGRLAAIAAGGIRAVDAMGDMVQILSHARKNTLAQQQSELINHAHPELIEEAEYKDEDYG